MKKVMTPKHVPHLKEAIAAVILSALLFPLLRKLLSFLAPSADDIMLTMSAGSFSLIALLGWAIGFSLSKKQSLQDAIEVDTQEVEQLHNELLQYIRRAEQDIDSANDFLEVLESKDLHTASHSRRVALYARKICKHMELDENTTKKIEEAALLHDLGKMALPDEILEKTGPLDEEEWEQIRKHTLLAAEILGRIPSFTELKPYVLHHHEGFAAKGYPHSLKGRKIPLGARVLSVADAFDALTSKRPYRQAVDYQEALDVIAKDKRFDPKVTKALCRALN